MEITIKEERNEQEQLELLKLAREQAEELADECNGDQKADVWICYPVDQRHLVKGFKKSKCSKCKVQIYYDTTMKNRMKNDAKKYCILCAMKDFKHDILPEQLNVLQGALC